MVLNSLEKANTPILFFGECSLKPPSLFLHAKVLLDPRRRIVDQKFGLLELSLFDDAPLQHLAQGGNRVKHLLLMVEIRDDPHGEQRRGDDSCSQSGP